MDTVSMLNKMSFYCQPILPLVYDESMSYYETLCKVVGQLNTTGDTVNKLNEGLTGEIADRQEADRRLNERLTSEIDNRREAERLLNERLKVVEEKTNKIHFLIFAGTPPHSARPVGAMPTRSELRQWINDRDMIVTLLETNDEERNIVYAMSCSYNAVNWTQESPADFNIIVPISTDYDSERDYAVRQKIAKITIPPDSVPSLDENWGLQVIEINTPSTSADGVVNLVAVISNSDSVNCSITPAEFFGLYNMARGGKNLCVAVNAKLEYDHLTRSSSIATVDIINRKIRIAFERDYGTFINNGVKQLIKTLDYIIGDVNTNIWTHETIDSKTLDFNRYEGFQFTRGENNVITANDESTPNAVYAQYNSDTSGKLYQNLPVRLVDTVDNAEYWNGVFDIKDNKHMTFTFVTSNYVTASGKMTVRVVELSADVNTTTWNYAEKEFTLPLTGGGSDTVYVDFWPTGTAEEYDKDIKGYIVELATDQTFDSIFDSIKAGNTVVARLYDSSDKSDSPVHSVDATVSGDKELGTINFQFVSTGTGNVAGFSFIGETITLLKGSSGTTIFLAANKTVLPTPNGDGTDNGKVPIINGTKWELKTPEAGGSPDAVLYTAQTLTDTQKKQAGENVDAAIGDFAVTATIQNFPTCTLDKTFDQIQDAISKGKRVFAFLKITAAEVYILSLWTYTSYEIQFTAFDYNYGLNKAQAYKLVVRTDKSEIAAGDAPTLDAEGAMQQVKMVSSPTMDMQIATKKYVDDHAGGGEPITIKLGTGNAATSTATFAEIKAALEAGKPPILDSVAGTNHQFALNWTLSGSNSLSIQYGSFEVTSAGAANFIITDVGVSSAGITYVGRQFTTE